MTGILDLRPPGSAEPIVLPTPPAPPRRGPLPLAATLIPIVGASVLWLVTGSMFMLLFAALGPLIAVASLLDGARAARRDRRRAARDSAEARERAEAELTRRHDAERRALWAVHPDSGALLQRPTDLWRPVAARADALVVGRGDAASTARVSGGDEVDADLRARAATLTGAPIAVSLGLGLCVVGPRIFARAVARALALQLCLVHSPDRLALVSVPAGEEWMSSLPHAAGGDARLRLSVTSSGQVVADDVDVVISVAGPGEPIPPRCGAILTVTAANRAELEHGAERRSLDVEGVSLRQAAAVAASLSAVSPASGGPGAVAFADLPPQEGGVGLTVPIGRGHDGVTVLDLVDDGPHAVVAGVTGSGKSELLITWIAAMCAAYTPQQVSFLLADFKGGTAFDALASLPHVTGVLTDLDAQGARRAIESLRSELRRREAALAVAQARDVSAAGTGLGRLVIVVDEFAAVLAEHPELGAVFTDVAARGRALGMHLVLGTQRLTGVVRDALLANCPLRISLRVTDAADSRAAIGGEAAARLPGDADGRGLAYVRRAADAAPRLTRIALTGATDLRRIAARHAVAERPHRPWLPALPINLPLADLDVPGIPDGVLRLGRADEPDHQRQPVVSLRPGHDRGLVVVGGTGSGKTNVVDLVAAQAHPDSVVRLPPDPEGAWDAIAALTARPRTGALILLDDLDAVAAALTPEHAGELLSRVERIARSVGAQRSTLVMTAQRLSGPIARIADLLPQRALLPMPTRLEHVSAGGEPSGYDVDAPAGRAVLAGRTMQFATVPAGSPPAAAEPAVWEPEAPLSVIALRGGLVPDALGGAPGARILRIDDLPSGARGEDLADDGRRVVLVGDPDGWQRHWNLWTRVRAEHGVVIAASCSAEYRVLSGSRALPPYASGHDRVWRVAAAGAVARLRLTSRE